jgi:hypothetical protein
MAAAVEQDGEHLNPPCFADQGGNTSNRLHIHTSMSI